MAHISTAKQFISLSMVTSHLRSQPLEKPEIENAHTFTDLIRRDPVSIHLSHCDTCNNAVPEDAATTVLPTTIIAAPYQEVMHVADFTKDSEWASTVRVLHLEWTHESHG